MLAQDHVHSAGLDSIQPQRSEIVGWDLFSIALWEKSDLLYSRPRINFNRSHRVGRNYSNLEWAWRYIEPV
ncbi:unnamed protein product (mitochondrion) [Musa acuminata var. zebrina]